MGESVSVALFTADLRLHDNPVLADAAAADRVVPLFVIDPGIGRAGFAVPNRAAFLAESLADLDQGLRSRGGRLVVRKGEPADVVRTVVRETGAREVHLASGVSRYAATREERLRKALAGLGCELVVHDAVVTAVPPGAVTPVGRDHFAVFTPYWRRWSAERVRAVRAVPRRITVPDPVVSRELPSAAELTGPGGGQLSPGLPAGGEKEGRRVWARWRGGGLTEYAESHDDMAGDGTSRLSPYLHFGCVSVVELVHLARESGGGQGAEDFVRQLVWRDFHHQVLAARPAAAWSDYRPRHDRWRTAPEELAAWREGRTGYPIVDAAMRQLRHEGWMHNRARLLVASFLTKTLYLDWKEGARHFLDLLVDGDLANNQLNWQWVAGTGTDTRPNRVLNPLVQAARFDPDGAYVRCWVPELAGLAGRAIHQPWKLGDGERAGYDYPEPLVTPAEGHARFARARGLE